MLVVKEKEWVGGGGGGVMTGVKGSYVGTERELC